MLRQICSGGSENCDMGQTAIQQMDSVYQSAPTNIASQFQSAHDAIMNQYQSTWYWGIDLIPFNPTCCTIYDLGTQASSLMSQIQSAMGQIGTPAPSVGSGLLPDILGVSGTTVLIIGAIIAGYLFLKK